MMMIRKVPGGTVFSRGWRRACQEFMKYSISEPDRKVALSLFENGPPQEKRTPKMCHTCGQEVTVFNITRVIEDLDKRSHKTRMLDWRGGETEFVVRRASEKLASEPWYAVRDVSSGWIVWIDYKGPPQLFLTKRLAKQSAMSMSKQYGKPFDIVRVGVIEN